MPSPAPERTNQETLGTLSRARKSNPFIIQLHFAAKRPGPGGWLGPSTPHLGVRRPRRPGVRGGTPGKHAEARGGECDRGLARPPPCRPLCSRALVLLTRLRGVGQSPPFSGPAPLLSGGAEPPLEVFLPLLFPTREKSHSREAEGRWNAACRSMCSDPPAPPRGSFLPTARQGILVFESPRSPLLHCRPRWAHPAHWALSSWA